MGVLYAMEPAYLVRQTFYGCAASFTKFLVALSSPVDVARLPKRDGPVRFDITRVTVDCQ